MTEIKEHPILFNAESVRAILEGRKVQTRRVMRPQPVLENGAWRWKPRKGWDVNVGHINPSMSPYGTFGDCLWLRETWAYTTDSSMDIIWNNRRYLYRATDPDYYPDKWRPSIFMPRRASRITLEVLDVRVGRVQEITEKDAQAEGAEKMCLDDLGQTWKTHRRGFRLLWDSINKKRGFDWSQNPWVWVVEFKVL